MINDLRRRSPRRFSPQSRRARYKQCVAFILTARALLFLPRSRQSSGVAPSFLSIALEMEMKRREFLKMSLAGAAAAAIAGTARAEDLPKVIRIGTQKGGFFPAVRQRHALEDTFKPSGIDVQWVDFQFGPPLLEAINVGSVDFGYVGDAPPIFAQAGGARIRYVAAVKSAGRTQGIVVPQDSPIKTLADLKGKRVAFGKGSSAHNLLVAALE